MHLTRGVQTTYLLHFCFFLQKMFFENRLSVLVHSHTYYTSIFISSLFLSLNLLIDIHVIHFQSIACVHPLDILSNPLKI